MVRSDVSQVGQNPLVVLPSLRHMRAAPEKPGASPRATRRLLAELFHTDSRPPGNVRITLKSKLDQLEQEPLAIWGPEYLPVSTIHNLTNAHQKHRNTTYPRELRQADFR